MNQRKDKDTLLQEHNIKKCPRKNWCLVNVDVKGVFQHHTWVKECVRSVIVLEKKCNTFFCVKEIYFSSKVGSKSVYGLS